MKSKWPPLIAFVGLALLGIGIYSLVRKPDLPAQANTSTNPSPTPLTIKIELPRYASASWNEYGPGHEGDPLNPESMWMRAVGSIGYNFNVPEIKGSEAIVRARLSSELGPQIERRVNGNPEYSSDVSLVVNGSELKTQNIIADDRKGTEYAWLFPSSLLKVGSDNTLVLQVKDSEKHKNGITIYGPILVQMR